MIDDFISVIVLIAIAFILPFFTTKAYAIYKPTPKIECGRYDSANYNICNKKRRESIQKYDQEKLMTMIIGSTVYIIMGVVGSAYNTNISLRGVSLGGLFLLISNIFRHWNVLDQEKQLFLLGLSLSALMYFGNQIKTSLKMYVVN